MQLAVQENLLGDASLRERAALARELGFDAVELRDAGRARSPELAAARRDGVVMPTVYPLLSGYLGDFDCARRRQAVAQMRDQLSGIAEAGGRAAIAPAACGMFSRRLPPFTPPRSADEDRDVLLESLDELGEHAAREGVLMLLEPINRYEDHMVNTVGQAAELCRELGQPAVRIAADTYHMNIEEADVCAALASVAPLLGAVHLSDSNRFEPGAGHVDFGAVLATLRGARFDGALSLECRLSGDAVPALLRSATMLRRLLDEDWTWSAAR
jgi:sugar phosphate isomerase/epimerase